MVEKISFGTGLYCSDKVLKRAKKESLDKLDNYAQETNSDLFVTKINEKNPNGTAFYTITARDGKAYHQIFNESKMNKPTTHDLYYTKIAGNPLKEPEIVSANIANFDEITFRDNKAVSKEDGTFYSGIVIKAKDDDKTFMLLKIIDGKIVSSKIVDDNNNVISGHIYSYDGDKLIHTIKCTPDSTLFIEHGLYKDNSTVFRDENYLPKKLVQHFPDTNSTVITDF